MTGSQDKTEVIFWAAQQIASPQERAAYLDQACQGDAQLRAHLDEMLAAYPNVGQFLEQSPAKLAGTIHGSPVEQPGATIGPYKLLQPIGEGGMGVVYMAEQTEPVQRKVALKIVKPGMDSRSVIARFEAERQALALMDHPNIARVLDAGTTDSGRPYFVMELVKGVPITKYCDEHHLTPRERLELFMPVCQAVQHAHQKGIIHRDLKPSNVLVALYDGKPVPKVIDFGVAKATGVKLTDRTLFTEFGQVVGTLEYMSPEQAELNQLDVDTRSDIYSLGVLLYELLTGTTPLDRKHLKEAAFDELLRIIREDEPQTPSHRLSTTEGLPSIAANRGLEPKKLSGLVRGELDWIVMKCLEKDRNRRYETANGFAMDVQRYLADEAVQACPPSAGYRLRKFVRRNKAALTTAGLLTFALLLTIVVLAVSNVMVVRERDHTAQALQDKEAALLRESAALFNAKEQENLAKRHAENAGKQRHHAQTQEKLARRRLYSAQMNLALRAWETGNLARALDLLEGEKPKPGEPDLRGFEWYCLAHLCSSGRQFLLPGHDGPVRSIAFSPDGTWLASGGTDRTIRFWDVAKGQLRRVLDTKHSVSALAFAPDGRTLVSAGGSTVDLWDVATGQVRVSLPKLGDRVSSVAFSPDGKTLVSGADDKMRLWDVADGKILAELEGPGTGIPTMCVAWSPDGKTIVQAGWRTLGKLKVWDVATRKVRFSLTGSYPIAFLSDGTLAAWGFGYKMTVWDVATGKERTTLQTVGLGQTMAPSPDGTMLAFGGQDRNVWFCNTTSGEFWPHHGCLATILSLAFSPNGRAIASASDDGTLELWDVAPAGTVELAQTQATSLRFSADGKILMASRTGRETKVWDVVSGKKLAESSVGGVISPDGTLVATVDGRVIKLFDRFTQKQAAALVGHEARPLGTIFDCAFSPDGKTLASASSDQTVRLWDLISGKPPVVLRFAQTTSSVAFSRDGKMLAVGTQFQGLELRDAETGRHRVTLRPVKGDHYQWMWSLAFSPDGKTLASGGSSGGLELWDIATGALRHTLKGHTADVNALTFSPDGMTLASGAESVKLWDPQTGQERVALRGHSGSTLAVAFSPDGLALATSGADGVRIWRAIAPNHALTKTSTARRPSGIEEK